MLSGRQPLLSAFDVVRRRAEELGEGERSWVLNGLRGVGKTVLLGELLTQVSDRGWITAKVEASSSTPFANALGRSLASGLRTAHGRHDASALRRVLAVFESFRVTVDPSGLLSLGFDVTPARGAADSGSLPDDLSTLFEELGSTARRLTVGVLILVDELQEADASSLEALNTAVHQLGQTERPAPLMVVGAGLPSLPAQLAEVTSYAERLYDYRPIGLLDDEQSRDALQAPALVKEVHWSPDGLEIAVQTAQGYPYFLQAVGKHVWDNASRSPISVEDVQIGLVAARREVDDGLYRSRWERATPAQRDVLRALASAGGAAATSVGDVARALGKRRTSDVSVARDALIKKGLLYAPERGLLAFTVPGMDTFVERQD